MLDSSGDDSGVLWGILLGKLGAHGESLATPRLTISENTHIVAIHKALDQVLYFVINFILSRCLTKDTIKVKELRLVFVRL